jgi:hypothetical protein
VVTKLSHTEALAAASLHTGVADVVSASCCASHCPSTPHSALHRPPLCIVSPSSRLAPAHSFAHSWLHSFASPSWLHRSPSWHLSHTHGPLPLHHCTLAWLMWCPHPVACLALPFNASFRPSSPSALHAHSLSLLSLRGPQSGEQLVVLLPLLVDPASPLGSPYRGKLMDLLDYDGPLRYVLGGGL